MPIRTVGVGLIALAAFAAASLLLHRWQLIALATRRRPTLVDSLYAAGL
ncbi:MAG: hypothetical protein OEO20_01000 [Gemmatimonadota bacterium]|nr:hypothetical protein [Gemmatimonadota bacterium]MDH3366609.1 hypothetical protein [Gemmatimonadota bacterium]MDH3476865.1 hypothetical protein [Gemmatimonadota bacterium]MDH3569483.1 hypothetical protein [Gemmatimonadota bacterium]MDH5548489.1 hypothetical protein [Gemmatimonadota bacterium]